MITLIKEGEEHSIFYGNEATEIREFIVKITKFLATSITITPPIDQQSLLMHTCESTTMIDDVIIFLPEMLKKDINTIKILLDKIFSRIWVWHQGIRERYDKIDNEFFSYSYIFSWINISRLLSMILRLKYIDKIDNLFDIQISELPFIQTISRVENVVISDDLI